ncbi:hypothetical protein BDN72DRAFT_844494, partial [Pluteus cervinus]
AGPIRAALMTSLASLVDLGEDVLGILADTVYEDRTRNGQDEDQDIRILCLVSRAFRVPCQRLLFRKIHLRNGRHPLTKPLPILLRLHSILSRNLHLSGYIRILKISQTFEGTIGDDLSHWVTSDPFLLEVLNLFASSPITTLRLSSRETMYWSDMDVRLHESFMAIFAKPTFRALRLFRVIIPPSLLSPTWLPHLENLCLIMTRIDTEETVPSIRVNDNRILSNVYIEFEPRHDPEHWQGGPTRLHTLTSKAGLDLRTVKCLGLNFGSEIIPTFGPAAPLLRDLTDLRIILHDFGQDLSKYFDLSSLVSLQNLTIYHRFQGSLEPSFFWTIKALASIPTSHSSLCSISVGLRFDFDETSKERLSLIRRLSDELQRLHKRPAGVIAPRGHKTELHFRPHHISAFFEPEPVFEGIKEAIAAYFRWGKQDESSGEFLMNLELNSAIDDWVYANSGLRSIMSL